MADEIVKLDPDERKKLEEEVEAELAAFNQFFQAPIPGGCGNSPLTRDEVALLRTYCVARRQGLFPSVLEGSRTSSA